MFFHKRNMHLPYGLMNSNTSKPYFHPYMQRTAQRNFPPYWPNYSPYPPMQPYSNNESSYLFENPLQSFDEPPSSNHMFHPYPMMHPYPQFPFVHKRPSGVSQLLNSFKSHDGSIDVKKMIDTASQMIYAVNQVTSMIKGLGGMFKV